MLNGKKCSNFIAKVGNMCGTQFSCIYKFLFAFDLRNKARACFICQFVPYSWPRSSTVYRPQIFPPLIPNRYYHQLNDANGRRHLFLKRLHAGCLFMKKNCVGRLKSYQKEKVQVLIVLNSMSVYLFS